ncbi:MAG: hypothetical protein ABI672_11280, partial [Vicinamibacteria bacterium]
RSRTSLRRAARAERVELYVVNADGDGQRGMLEMYLRAFNPEAKSKGAVSGPRIPLPTGASGTPRWRGDGRQLLYVASDGRMMVLPVTLGATEQTGRRADRANAVTV